MTQLGVGEGGVTGVDDVGVQPGIAVQKGSFEPKDKTQTSQLLVIV
jgi:hypothetical protein